MRRHSRRKPGPITYPFNHTRHVCRAIELAHLLGHAQIRVDERFVIDDHVFVGGVWVGGFLEAIGLAAKEVCPKLDLDEVEEGDDVAWAELGARGFAEEEEVEEFDADGMTLEIEARENKDIGQLQCVFISSRERTQRSE